MTPSSRVVREKVAAMVTAVVKVVGVETPEVGTEAVVPPVVGRVAASAFV
jgi:hypothetical protein